MNSKSRNSLLLLGILLIASCLQGCSGGGFNDPDVVNDILRVWGGESVDSGDAIAVDADGNVFVAGIFSIEADFDPGAGTDMRTTDGSHEFFLARYDSSGVYQWVKTWGGTEYLQLGWIHDMAVDNAGGIYIVGYFIGPLDFNPGEGVEDRTSNGASDGYLLKLNTDGDFQWVNTWGETGLNEVIGVDIDDSQDVYLAGYFSETFDSDPGAGVNDVSAEGDTDVFVVKLDANGDFIWARTFGGGLADYPSSIAVDNDGMVIIPGNFRSETIDLDPGDGTDVHESFADYDVFLTRLTSDGEYVWGNSWGGYGDDSGPDIDTDDAGNIYIVGELDQPMDVDPGPDAAMLYSNGRDDIYLSKFNPGGEFQWGMSWGGQSFDRIGGIYAGSYGVYVAAYYHEKVDYDPGPGKSVLDGYQYVCVSNFSYDGSFRWVGRWGSEDTEICRGIAVNAEGYVFLTGSSEDLSWYRSDPDGVMADAPPSNPDACLVRFPPYYEGAAMDF